MSITRSGRVDVSPRRWLYLRVTIKPREFKGAALLALEAAERGWGVILGKDIYLDGPGFPRGVMFEKGMTPGRADTVEASRVAGHKVVAICEEGLIYSSVEDYARAHLDRRAFDLLDLYFAWGENQKSDLVDRLECRPERIVLTGNARFDLHRPELRGIFAAEVEAIRRRIGPYILINTKFSKYNSHVDLEKKLGGARRKGKLRDAADESYLRGLREFHQAGFEGFVALAGELSRRYPDRTIVVRPHPSEDHDRWRHLTARMRNARVLFDGNVIGWILGADVSIHNNCTTGVEAYLLDRPTISYRPVRDERFDLKLPNALSSEAFSLEETCAFVDAALRGARIEDGKDPTAQAAMAGRYLANATGEFAAERMMDAIERLDVAPEALSVVPRRAGGWALGRGLRRMRDAFASPEAGARRRFVQQKFDGLDTSELREFQRAAQAVAGRFHDVQLAELGKNILCVYR